MTLSLELSQIQNFNVNRKPVSTPDKVEKMINSEEKKKRSKWRNVTNELAMFNVKVSPVFIVVENAEHKPDNDDSENTEAQEANTSTSNEIDYEFSFEIDDITSDNDDPIGDDEHLMDSLYNVNRLAYYKYLNQNNYKEIKQSSLKNSDQIRAKKANKRVKLKAVIKSNSFLAQININMHQDNKNIDLLKSIKFNSLFKSNSKLHIKYNIYNKLFNYDSWNGRTNLIEQAYVGKMDRAQHLFSKSKSSNSADRSDYPKGFSVVAIRKTPQEQTQQQQQQDIPALNAFSIDHNRVHGEITENYDQLYVEFLISLQHREITPEDYEYLSRLDELVKKKTVSEAQLSKFKNEKVTSENVDSFINDMCAICMDVYLVQQVRKHLPCGHIFHDTCIDGWLSSNSTKCPLDQQSLDSFSRSVSMNGVP